VGIGSISWSINCKVVLIQCLFKLLVLHKRITTVFVLVGLTNDIFGFPPLGFSINRSFGKGTRPITTLFVFSQHLLLLLLLLLLHFHQHLSRLLILPLHPLIIRFEIHSSIITFHSLLIPSRCIMRKSKSWMSLGVIWSNSQCQLTILNTTFCISKWQMGSGTIGIVHMWIRPRGGYFQCLCVQFECLAELLLLHQLIALCINAFCFLVEGQLCRRGGGHLGCLVGRGGRIHNCRFLRWGGRRRHWGGRGCNCRRMIPWSSFHHSQTLRFLRWGDRGCNRRRMIHWSSFHLRHTFHHHYVGLNSRGRGCNWRRMIHWSSFHLSHTFHHHCVRLNSFFWFRSLRNNLLITSNNITNSLLLESIICNKITN